jgi:hypothetical protein
MGRSFLGEGQQHISGCGKWSNAQQRRVPNRTPPHHSKNKTQRYAMVWEGPAGDKILDEIHLYQPYVESYGS